MTTTKGDNMTAAPYDHGYDNLAVLDIRRAEWTGSERDKGKTVLPPIMLPHPHACIDYCCVWGGEKGIAWADERRELLAQYRRR